MTGPVIQSTSDVQMSGANIIVYGPSGVGKTRLITTLPSPLILSAERGLLSLRKYNLPYIAIETMKDLDGAMDYINRSNDAKKFGAFAMDSVTEIAQVCLADEMTKTPNGQKAYGEMATKMEKHLRMLRNIPRISYLIAHVDSVKDDMMGTTKFGPSFPGKVLTGAAKHMYDEIYYYAVWENTETKTENRALLTRPNAQYDAKSRGDVLEQWEPADLSVIINKLLARN